MPRITTRPGQEKMSEKSFLELWQEALDRDEQQEIMDAAVDEVFGDKHIIASSDPIVQENVEIVKTRYAYTFIQLVLGIFTSDNPRWEQRPVSERQKDRDIADKIALWLNLAYWRVLEQGHQDTWQLQIQDVLKYGRGIQKIHLAPHLWLDEPKLAKDEDPIEWSRNHKDWLMRAKIPMAARHVHPRNFHSWYDGFGMQQAIEVQLRQVRDITGTYWDLADAKLKSKKPSDLVWWFEHQNRSYITYGVVYDGGGDIKMLSQDSSMAQGYLARPTRASQITILEQIPHHFGRPSFVEIDGDRETFLEVQNQRLSILWPMMPLIKQLDRALSQVATNVKTTGWYFPYFQMGENPNLENVDSTGRPRPLEMKPFRWTPFFKDEKPGAFTPPPLPPDVYRYINQLQTLIEQHGLLPVLQGQVADYSAGYAINQRTHAARSRYNAIGSHIKNGFKEVGELMLKCVEILGGPIYVYDGIDTSDVMREKKRGRTIGYLGLESKDIAGYDDLSTRMSLSLPTDKQLMYRIAREATSEPNPVISMYEARNELLELDDPSRTERMVITERMDRMVLPFLAQRIIEDVEMDLQKEGVINKPPERPAGAPEGQPPGNPVLPGTGQALVPTPPNTPASATSVGMPPAAGGATGGQSSAPNTPIIPTVAP